MSGISGGGAARRAIHEFDEALDAAAEPDTTSKHKVSKTEMRDALKELAPVQGKLTARNRNEIWAKIEQHALTPTARKLAEQTIGPEPAIGPRPPPGAGGPPKDGPRLAKHLEALAKDLVYMSEGDYPYEAFSRPLAPSKPLTDAELLKAFRLPEGTPLISEDIFEWFKEQESPDSGADAAEVAKWRALEAAYAAGLKDAQLILVGPDSQVEAKVYLVGRAPDGSITGLSSTRIWT